MRTSLFIGRWQVPELHRGHRELIKTALAEGNYVVVAVRDTPLDEANPFPLYVRCEAIRRAFNDQVSVIIVPDKGGDLEICYGRKVGYSFRHVDLPERIEAISGTRIRAGVLSGRIVWLTGNSGAGKTTLARHLAGPLLAVVLDGNEMRESISVGAGFSEDERLEHNLRVARLAEVLSRQGNVVVSVIAPTERIRDAVEEVIRPIWVYVKRELPDRPGYFYDPPTAPALVVDSDAQTSQESASAVLDFLEGLCES